MGSGFPLPWLASVRPLSVKHLHARESYETESGRTFGTYSGGSGRDLLEGLDVDSDGTVAVSGLTFSKDHPMPGRVIERTQSEIRVGGQVANAVTWVFRVSSQ